MKKTVLFVVGVIILRAYLSKWVPFTEFTENDFKLAVTTVWSYGGVLIGVLCLAPLLGAVVEKFHLAEKLFW